MNNKNIQIVFNAVLVLVVFLLFAESFDVNRVSTWLLLVSGICLAVSFVIKLIESHKNKAK